LTLDESNGLDLIKDLKTAYPDIKILVISMHDEDIYAERALRAGAHGYIMKQQASTNAIDAYMRLWKTATILALPFRRRSSIVRFGYQKKRRICDFFLKRPRIPGLPVDCQGLGVIEIANQLNLSVKTIESYRYNLKIKLNLPDAAALRKFAIRWLQTHPPG